MELLNSTEVQAWQELVRSAVGEGRLMKGEALALKFNRLCSCGVVSSPEGSDFDYQWALARLPFKFGTGLAVDEDAPGADAQPVLHRVRAKTVSAGEPQGRCLGRSVCWF